MDDLIEMTIEISITVFQCQHCFEFDNNPSQIDHSDQCRLSSIDWMRDLMEENFEEYWESIVQEKEEVAISKLRDYKIQSMTN